MEESTSPPPRERKPFQNFRSTASINWRNKDDSPRVESPQQQRGGDREQGTPRYSRDRGDESNNSYSPRPRNNGSSGYNSQPRGDRERQEIPTEVTTPRLYVGNLLYTAQQSDIESFFAGNGFNVANVSMSIDPMTGRNPSYCFVDLESVEDAKRAMDELNGQEVMGRSIRINPGVGRKERDGPGRDGQRVKSFEGSRPSWKEGTATAQGEQKPAADRWQRSDAPSQWTKPSEQGKRLYIGGLPQMEPQSAVEAEIQELITSLNLGVEVTAVSKLISPHQSKLSEPGDHYYLFVDVSRSEDIERIMEKLDGVVSPWSEDQQGKLKVNRAKENTGRKVGREQGDRPSYRERGDGQQPQGERSFGRPSWRDSSAQ